MKPATIGLVGAVLMMAACASPCPSLCDDMAAFARDCGVRVDQAEIDSCREDEDVLGADARSCRQFGNTFNIEQAWTCNDIRAHYAQQIQGESPK